MYLFMLLTSLQALFFHLFKYSLKSNSLIIIFFVTQIFTLLISYILQLNLHDIISSADIFEIGELGYKVIILYFCVNLVHQTKILELKKAIILISFCSFLLIIVQRLGLFDTSFYGVSGVFDHMYGRFRAYGITGQPGTQSILLYLLNVFISQFVRSNIISVRLGILLFLMNTFSIFLTGSRFGLLFNALLAVIIIFSNIKRSKFLWFTVVSAILLANLFMEDIISVIYRGGDSLKGALYTFERRLEYKSQIYVLLNENLKSAFFGIGPSKDYIYSNYSELRHPDSTLSIFLIRFGVLGTLINCLWIFALIKILFTKNNIQGALSILLLLIYAWFEPIIEDPKCFIVLSLLIGYLTKYSNNKDA